MASGLHKIATELPNNSNPHTVFILHQNTIAGDLLTIGYTALPGSSNYVANLPGGNSVSHFGTVQNERSLPALKPPSQSFPLLSRNTLANPALSIPPQSSLPYHQRRSAGYKQRKALSSSAGKQYSSTKAFQAYSGSIERAIAKPSPTENLAWERDEKREYQEKGEDFDNEKNSTCKDNAKDCRLDVTMEDVSEVKTIEHTGDPEFSARNHQQIEAGYVFTIDKGAGSQLANRTMILLAPYLGSMPQCVSLCRHSRMIEGRSNRMLSSHIPVFAEGSESARDGQNEETKVVIRFLSEDSKLLSSCWVNLHQTYTLPSRTPFYVEGHVLDFKDVLNSYAEKQKELYQRVRTEL
ncbi:MAG: hypothetical protein M1821_004589 [Bathelium mastoideum]|nr:MAG: hypothetical protein M1821_004589 [Bathelium mastoideum]